MGLLVALALAVAAPAGGYPPRTCGQVTWNLTQYVVRSHGPKCGDALRGVRSFLERHRAPRGFKCRAFGLDTPAYCKDVHHPKSRYFLAESIPA